MDYTSALNHLRRLPESHLDCCHLIASLRLIIVFVFGYLCNMTFLM